MTKPISRRQFIEHSSKVAAGAAGAALGGGLVARSGPPETLSQKEAVSAVGAVAAPALAARAGAAILQRGGNAMDAAAAACLVCGVTLPHLVCIGGYVAAGVVLEGRTGKIWSLDGNSTAPSRAHEGMFKVTPLTRPGPGLNETEYECHVAGNENVFGPLAVGVPGFIGGVGLLWERWGKLKWPEIVSPSLDLLADGFPFGAAADAIKAREAIIRRFEPSVKHLMPGGRVPKSTDIWHRPDMEATLSRLSSAGWRDFYDGEVGRRIADYIEIAGGILSRADMASFHPSFEPAYAASYRKAKIYGATLPHGALTALQALNMLDGFEPVPQEEPIYWHRFAEVLKLAWRDRLRYLGDPKFAAVPVNELLSRQSASDKVRTLRQHPNYVDRAAPTPARVSPQGTVHVSAADAGGNVVAMTISQGGWFGSCVTVPGTGLVLGHGMCRFDPRPGRPNSVQARKRPLNNVCPMVVRAKGRDFAAGLAGGRKIVSVSAQIVQRLLDQNITPLQAVTAPRMHIETNEPMELEEAVGDGVRSKLIDMGHEIVVLKQIGSAAQIAEFVKADRTIRAAGNAGAAGAAKTAG